MSISLSPGPFGQRLCVTTSGGAGGRVEVIVDTPGLAQCIVIDLDQGAGFHCFSLPNGIGDGVLVSGTDALGNDAVAVLPLL